MSQTFHSLRELAEFLSDNVDKSFKIKTKFSHKEGKTEVQYYTVTEHGDCGPKIYIVVTNDGRGFDVILKDECAFAKYDTPLNYVFHTYHNGLLGSHAVFVEANSVFDADEKGKSLLQNHFSSALYAGVTGNSLLHEVKSLYNTPWGFGEKINNVQSLTNIRVSDFFLTDKTISIKFIADIH
jgi:hypothetical protein